VPGYELITELGRGGMGVVYQARHLKLDRLVALKMILAGSHAGAAELARFQTEAEAVARLRHPNIVQVYDVGEHEGKPFFSLEFCGGGSLKDRLNGTPLSAKEAAALVQTLACAMQTAHEQHVIHRDLKPANVLLAEDGTLKITDFGLAKKLDEAGQTQSGAIMGTPSYMAPEQAGGKAGEIGPAADVYALGAILYECLTGRPPFRAATALDTIMQVIADEPVAVRQLQPKTPRDLETICLKCLEKDPGKRYASAGACADDLARFLAGEPIHARPTAVWERAVKWARRRPGLTALAAFSAAVALVAFALVTWKWREATAAQWNAEVAGEAERAQKLVAEGARKEAETRKREAEAELRRSEASLYNHQIVLADRYVRENNFPQADQTLAACRPGLRNWEWRYLQRLCTDHGFIRPEHVRMQIHECATPEGGTRYQLECTDRRVLDLTFSPDGKQIASTGDDHTIKLWDAATGQHLRTLRGQNSEVRALAFSPDSSRLASGSFFGESIILWDVTTGEPLTTFHHPALVTGVAFSPDGKHLASAARSMGHGGKAIGGGVKVWDLDARREILALEGEREFSGVAFSPNGKWLATMPGAQIRDVETGKPLFAIQASGDRIAFSPDGKRLASVDGKPPGSREAIVSLWEGERFETKSLSLRGLTGAVRSLAFSPDGKRLAAANDDLLVKVWDVATGAEALTLRGAGSAVAYSPDGKRLAAVGWDDTIRVWDAQQGQAAPTFPGNQVVFDADGRRMASCSAGGLKVWEVSTGRECFGLPSGSRSVALSPDGKRLAAGGMPPASLGQGPPPAVPVRVWDLASGKEALTLDGCRGSVIALTFSPNGRRLAAVDEFGGARSGT
jgi:WD40 repeat protein